jgi:glycosyltransferase involved in cell wall biosynthesis
MLEFTSMLLDEQKTEPIRVLHLIFTLVGGGAEKQLVNFVNHANCPQIENAICCFDEKGLSKIRNGIKTFVITKKHKLDISYRKVREVYKIWNPDIIHVWLPSMLIYSLPAAKFRYSRKFLAGYRGNCRLDSAKRFVQFLFLLLSDSIVSNIPYECLHPPYKQLLKLKRGKFIPNGFQMQTTIEKSGFDLQREQGHQDYRLLFVGRLDPVKNIPLLFHALQILLARKIRCRLLIAGEGSQRDDLLKLSEEMGLEEAISFLGFQENIPQLMKESELLVLPSFQEGMSNSLFEALSVGLPVAASDIPVHRYWLKHDYNAVLFDPQSPLDLAAKIEYVRNKSDINLQKIVNNAKIMVAELSIGRMVYEYQSFYQEITGR